MSSDPGLRRGDKSTKIVLVRHGETRWNVEQRIQGQGDSPLTEAGIEQARAIGRRLAREHFDRLVASDLGRAMQTASEIGALTRHAVVPTRASASAISGRARA